MVMNEIHFYTRVEYIPDHERYYADWEGTYFAIERAGCVRTTQMGFLSTDLFLDGFRVFVHDSRNDFYEIKLGCDNERTNREIRMRHDLFKLWKNGEFGGYV
jgi:hypothetical protein